MKIKEWIILGLLVLTATASQSLGAESGTPSIQENFVNLEKAIQASHEQVTNATKGNTFRWVELENFNTSLWRAMALDPIVGPGAFSVSQVPKTLYSFELNADLIRQFEELKKSPYPKELKAEAEFSQYVTLVERMINMRKVRQFPIARGLAKRGQLDAAFSPLLKKVTGDAASAVPLETTVPALTQVTDLAKTLREQLEVGTKNNMKKEVFNNGNQFIWFMMASLAGFILGIFGYRLNPNFFQKMLDYFDTNAPAATTHSSGAKLDYARWLKEFEELLSRLKVSQSSHERRIEDIVQNSEKISQHALSLYADARIKNEANLEYRMSALVREIQTQFDQSQRLQAGDRAQINVLLEHCLNLCDAVENNSVQYSQNRQVEPPAMSQAS